MHYHSLGNQKSIFIYKNNIFCLAVYTQTFVQQIGFVLDKVILENPMGGMKIVHCQDLHNILQNVTSTLNRKTLTSFVRTKPRGSVVITKPLVLRMSLCARKASWLHYMVLYH